MQIDERTQYARHVTILYHIQLIAGLGRVLVKSTRVQVQVL